MKSFAAILAIAGVAAAQTTALPAAQAASCASNYQICSSSGTVAASCDQQRTNCVTSCQTKYDACRAPGPAGSANQAQCAAEYASCLGTNPFAGPASGVTTVTEVVSSYTTYCPAATSVVQNGQTYIATGPTVLTITNCPCTVTRAVTSVPTGPAAGTTGPGAATTPVTNVATGKTGNNTTPSYTPVAYKGDAAKMVGAGLSFAAAGAGALAFFL